MALHMNGGQGDTSYATQSKIQKNIIYETKQIFEETVQMLCSTVMPKTMNIADLGCGPGPNALLSTTMILEFVPRNCARLGQPTPEFHIFLNDVPENDFNNLFKITQRFQEKLRGEKGYESDSCFVSATPGSFYGRLFPTDSLHLVYSANCLHWLSKVPPSLSGKNSNLNKGYIALTKTSPSGVLQAYLEQFRSDLHVFLRSRSQEIVPKGFMVLSFMGRRTKYPFEEHCIHTWDSFSLTLQDMVEEGIIEQTILDSFNLPYFNPHLEEVRKLIEEEGSFDIIQLQQSYETPRIDNITTKTTDTNIYKIMANCARAVTESLLSNHFAPAIIEELFKRFEEKLSSITTTEYSLIVISLSKKG